MTAYRGDPADAPTRGGALCGSRKRLGGVCRNTAGKGTDHVGFGHCWLHGGRSPGGTRMAQREAAYAAARTLHLPVDDPDADPDTLILGLVREQASVVAWLRDAVRALPADALVRSARYARRVDTSGGQFPGTTTTTETGAVEHVLSQMYARERRIFADLLVKTSALKINRRHVELAEEQGEMAGQLMVAALRELGVDPASPRAQDVIRRHFTIIAGGPDAHPAVTA